MKNSPLLREVFQFEKLFALFILHALLALLQDSCGFFHFVKEYSF